MDSSFNAFQIFQSAAGKLSGTYEKEEAAANVRWLMEDKLGFSRVDIALKKQYAGGEVTLEEFHVLLDKICKGEPIQYVLGYTEFLGRKYQVNSSVLIPRPETEELVSWIIKNNPMARTILDIGTGSGCIAISLAKAIKSAEVMAWDIDQDTLAVATRNAENLNAPVQMHRVDVLETWPETLLEVASLDLIVSNPPYIMEQEKPEMRNNVLNYEPSTALFVPNEDPLLFYRKIAEEARPFLSNGGKLYFEINENFGLEVINLMESLGYIEANINKDLQGKSRMIQGTWMG